MNAKAPGSKCFGFVTMSSKEDAAKCISELNRTELNGQTITVERVCFIFVFSAQFEFFELIKLYMCWCNIY